MHFRSLNLHPVALNGSLLVSPRLMGCPPSSNTTFLLPSLLLPILFWSMVANLEPGVAWQVTVLPTSLDKNQVAGVRPPLSFLVVLISSPVRNLLSLDPAFISLSKVLLVQELPSCCCIFFCYYIHLGKAYNCIHSYALPFRPKVSLDLCY